MLNLYTFFHLNLAYSSIEEDQRLEVVKRCYWPLLRLARKFNLPFGIETSGYTLEQIQEIDRNWIDELRFLIHNGPCEFVGSGYAQIIAPLVPAEVNAANLRLGNQIYKQLLGVIPEVALVNEQAYSAGILRHYLAAGYKGVVMEWDNPARFHPEWHPQWRYYPQVACGQHGEEIPLIWNYSIAFQKFQRYAHGEMQLDDYLRYLKKHGSESPRFFPLYGNDVEIFDFRPNRYQTEPEMQGGSEWQRIERLFAELLKTDWVKFVTPGKILEKMHLPGAGNRLSLETSQQPVPVKKQGKYNMTRWAVTGKNDLDVNTACWRIYREVLNQTRTTDEQWRRLCYLWSSDFRTHITLRRWQKYCDEIQSLVPSLREQSIWEASRPRSQSQRVCEESPTNLTLVPKLSLGTRMAARSSFQTPSQFKNEEDSPHVISSAARNLVASSDKTELLELVKSCEGEQVQDDPILETDLVELRLKTQKGLAIDGLWFKEISSEPLLGTLPHGFYDDISLGADFFSGHLIFETPGHSKITDLVSVKPLIQRRKNSLEVGATIETPFGPMVKKVTVFSGAPRVDIEYAFSWRNLPAGSLRLGMITLNPDAFDAATLYYSCHNGGYLPEKFHFGGTNFDQGSAVSFLVSASQGVGMTDGSMTLGDAGRAIRVQVDKASASLIGLVAYKEIANSYFCRVSFSAKEMDETCATNGVRSPQPFRKTFRFSILPVKAEPG